VKRLVEALKKKETPKPAQPLQPSEPPLLFVDVNPALASAEPPKKATHYSSLNSEAANPDIDKESNLPKIDGEQKHVIKTEDAPRNKPVPLQPAPAPPSPPEPERKEEAKPKPAEPRGDLAMAKPEPKPVEQKEQKEPAKPHTRPLTLREAYARMPANLLAGQKMKQEGGVRRKLQTSLFDTEASPLGAYDRALIDAIQNRWYALLDERNYAAESRGKVVIQFVLHPDGRVTDMSMGDNTAGEVLGYLCEKAIQDPAPFPAWPIELRRMIGETRQITFTFYYDIY
jgi:outer membrane biosynthesis protein TonB